MYYISSRNKKNKLSLSDSLKAGIASDGGLFVPEKFPLIQISDFDSKLDIASVAKVFLKAFFENDSLSEFLSEICDKTFSFEIPLKQLDENTALLELFHGPTSAFKDIGARFLSECFKNLIFDKSSKKKIVLVATSGDTGGAVANAFLGFEDISVVVLYPQNGVSELQEKQFSSQQRNVKGLAVEGSFDDCQRIVKEAFASKELSDQFQFISANSINIGRLLPQAVYYAYASLLRFKRSGELTNFIIPSGNMGNGVAALWAKKCGLPIGDICFSTNENKAVADYIQNKIQKKVSYTINTLANAMDVSLPSNLERFIDLEANVDHLFLKDLRAASATDEDILQEIKSIYVQYSEIICPHTATAFVAKKSMNQAKPWVIVSTAHPAKFNAVVKAAIGIESELSEELKKFDLNTVRRISVEARLDSLISQLE